MEKGQETRNSIKVEKLWYFAEIIKESYKESNKMKERLEKDEGKERKGIASCLRVGHWRVNETNRSEVKLKSFPFF